MQVFDDRFQTHAGCWIIGAFGWLFKKNSTGILKQWGEVLENEFWISECYNNPNNNKNQLNCVAVHIRYYVTDLLSFVRETSSLQL